VNDGAREATAEKREQSLTTEGTEGTAEVAGDAEGMLRAREIL
jgi:hypothetical protein